MAVEEDAGCAPAEMGKEPPAAPDSPPIQPLVPAHGRGAVSRKDAGQLCTLAGPTVAGGGGGGTASGPINLGSDVDTNDDSGSSESEPDGTFAIGSARDSPGRGQAGATRFVGRDRTG